jgi:hypothetical protein
LASKPFASNTHPRAELATPKEINTTEKPSTNARPCEKVTQRLYLLSPAEAIERPPRYPTYAGTREKTQGEKKEAIPARNARLRLRFS